MSSEVEFEKDMIASTERGEWVSVGDLPTRAAFWKNAATETLSGARKRISILIPERDLSRLKAKAAEEGMPYQTFINSILHKAVS